MQTEEFWAALPAALVANKAFAAARGTLAVIIEGPGGGAWTIHLGDVDDPVRADDGLGDLEDPDLMIVWTVAAFEALLRGERDVAVIRPAALAGNEGLLKLFGQLLQPAARGGVGARLASLAA